MRKYTVKLLYKSGAEVVVKCEAFNIKHSGGTLTSVSWTNARPRPLHIGVDDIAAVFEL